MAVKTTAIKAVMVIQKSHARSFSFEIEKDGHGF
jgi:hypothetical protein